MNRLKISEQRSLAISYVAIFVVYGLIKFLSQTEIISSYFMQVINLALINGLMAMSLNVVNGITGQFSLGHAGFMSVGAYTSAMITMNAISSGAFSAKGASGQIILIISCFAAGIMASLIGVLIGIPSLRLRGDYLAIITLGFGEIIRTVWRVIPATGQAKGLSGIPKLANFNIIFATVVISLFVYRNFLGSSNGRSCLAIRENELAADAMGIDTTKIKVKAFAFSAFMAGIAGALYAHLLMFVQPDMFSYVRSNDFLVYLYAGGIGSFTSGLLGAVALTIIPETLRFLVNWRLVLYAFVLILIMLNRPQGILGAYEFPFMRYDDSFGRFPIKLKKSRSNKQ